MNANCFVTKLKSVVDNDNLRTMYELRLTAQSSGDGTKVTIIQALGSNEATFKIMKGNAYFVGGDGVNLGTETSGGSARLIVSSGTAQVSIVNYNNVCSTLGYEDSNLGRFFVSESDSNAPIVVLDLKEVKDKTFITKMCIKDFSDFIKGDISNLKNLSALESIEFIKGSEELVGDLSSITNLTGIEKLYLGGTNSDQYKTNIHWGINDIVAMTSLTDVSLIGGYLDKNKGTDLYNLCRNKSSINLRAGRGKTTDAEITCSYISGISTIPTIAIDNISFYKTATINKANLVAFMTMIKDGYNSNKITANAISFKTPNSVIKDADVISIKQELINLGVTVTLEV